MRGDLSAEEKQAVRRQIRRAIIGGLVSGGLGMAVIYPFFAQAPKIGRRITIVSGQYKVISKTDDSSTSGLNLYCIQFEEIPVSPFTYFYTNSIAVYESMNVGEYACVTLRRESRPHHGGSHLINPGRTVMTNFALAEFNKSGNTTNMIQRGPEH